MRSWCWVALVVLAGCDNSVPTFPIYGRDAGLECGGDLGDCGTGQVCLQGFCYARCSDTNPCGPRETCSSEGICESAGDAGMPDAAPPDPCDTAGCAAPTPFCRAGTGICIACEANAASPPQCGGATPLCDVARGSCFAFVAPAVCAPCASDFECAGTAVATACVLRGGTAPVEQVCLPTCPDGVTCPAGYTCEGTSCVPTLGASCTGVRAAVDRRVCASDADCAPLGATSTTGLFVGSCFDDDGDTVPTCHHPCGGVDPCPEGLTCNTAVSFCM